MRMTALIIALLAWAVVILALWEEDLLAPLWQGMKEGFRDIIDALLGRRRKPKRPVLDDELLEAGYQAAINEPTEPRTVVAWSPFEREIAGVDDTDNLIRSIDSELKCMEWDRIAREHGPQGIVLVTNGHPYLPGEAVPA